MALVLLVLAAILFAAGCSPPAAGATGRLALIPQAGAVIVVLGVVLLAWFVFSGDPYVNGAASRWSRRTSHVFVYAAWIASTIIAPRCRGRAVTAARGPAGEPALLAPDRPPCSKRSRPCRRI